MRINIKWHGLHVKANVELRSWEGDPSVPNGIHYLQPHAEEIEVYLPDGYSLADDDLSDSLWESLEELLIEAAKDLSESPGDFYEE